MVQNRRWRWNSPLSFFGLQPEDKPFTGAPYAELSDKDKLKITQYKKQKARSLRGPMLLTDKQFYRTLSEKELSKILKK